MMLLALPVVTDLILAYFVAAEHLAVTVAGRI